MKKGKDKMKDIWKYLEYIVWPIAILIILIGGYLIYTGSDLFTKVCWFVGTIIALFGEWKGIPRIIQHLKLKGVLNSFANEAVKNLLKISDNKNFIKHSKIKIDGFNKNNNEFSYARGETKHIMLLNEKTELMKQKIILACTESCLPMITKEGLLNASSLRSLSLFLARECIQPIKDRYALEEYIEKELKENARLKKWFEIWEKINKVHKYFGSEKNTLYQFLCPKLENIAKSKKSKDDKKDEINFLIENLRDYKIPIIYLFLKKEHCKKQESIKGKKKSLKEIYVEDIYNLMQTYPYLVLTARGQYIGFMMSIANKLREDYSNIEMVYEKEVDIWKFPGGNEVAVNWLILENKTFK